MSSLSHATAGSVVSIGAAPVASARLSRAMKPAMLAAFAATLFLFFQLGTWRPAGHHESLAIVPAQEMLRTGDFLVPTYAGEPRLRKPPLVYWTHATVGRLAGRIDTATARLPSALAAVGLAILLFFWADAWYGRTAAVAAFLAQVSSVYVVTYGRSAEVDMTLCLLSTAALFLIAPKEADDRGSLSYRDGTIIGLLAAVSWLGKFHFGPAMIFGVAIVWLTLRGRRDQIRKLLLNPGTLVALPAAIFVWPMLLLAERPDAIEIWLVETVGRAVGATGSSPIWYYVPHLLGLSMPWTIFAIPGAVLSFQAAWPSTAASLRQRFSWRATSARRDARPTDLRERFLWVWLLTQLAILSLSVNKHSHYLLPALPICSLWAARRIEQLRKCAARGEPLLNVPATCVAVAAVLAGLVYLVMRLDARHDVPVLSLSTLAASIFASAAIVALVLLPLRKPKTAAILIGGVGCFGFIVGLMWVLPSNDGRQEVAASAQRVDALVPPYEPLFAFDIGEHAVVGHLDRPIKRANSIAGLRQMLAVRDAIWVIAPSKSTAVLHTHRWVDRDWNVPFGTTDLRVVRLRPVDRSEHGRVR
ncbi:ArnT family glycosyltransferase [Stratiformator vulcanicus]|uniref:Undecaprenyl phosphate-alpha-4-amino-4-deoxy-L-arabinose arabinosyl transferase n=1 Tax=Stratiformator vulcanicus TaxID=2527980 RepID=A0A517R6L6_9PLAN|nr:glycosyltransferase family 39 protein [Stratiformator vulcanicus]QDT39529.1 Undecaprenyl phosphate-alpha-4-amino-4-deoxy-L-arabinose arabinosyl transferase [Stratiformator vulcanicus]